MWTRGYPVRLAGRAQINVYQDIEYRHDGAVAYILHARPNARNAESRNLLDEMDQALSAAVADDAVRAIVIGGQGDHFSAGHDLKEAERERQGFTVEQRWAYEEKRYFDYALRIWDCPKPTIARVQGACIAGGFMVAKEFLYTGERMPATEAHAIGMVNRVVPRSQLDADTQALAAKVAEAPPFAMKLMKRSLNRTFDAQGFRTALAAHFDTHQLSHMSDEFASMRAGGLSGAIGRGKA